MMSQSKHKPSTRERIVTQAGSLAKQQGFGTVGVDALMAAANLKGGSFYYHFPKKEALLTAIVIREIQASRAWLTEQGGASKEALQQRLIQYLSQEHVLNPEEGCVLPALSAEVARAETETRQAYAKELQNLVKDIERIFDNNHASWPVIAMCVGALVLARAMPAGDERKRLLADCVQQLMVMLAC